MRDGSIMVEVHCRSAPSVVSETVKSMADLATTGYTVDDLDWLRNEIARRCPLGARPRGSLILSPATDEHSLAVAVLSGQAVQQLNLPLGCVRTDFAWVVPGSAGYLMIPDVAIVAAGSQRVDELHLDPPPLLVVEIASPSTRRVDRTRKLADYRLGGAEQYLLVDLPADLRAARLRRRHGGQATRARSTWSSAGQPVRFSLPA